MKPIVGVWRSGSATLSWALLRKPERSLAKMRCGLKPVLRIKQIKDLSTANCFLHFISHFERSCWSVQPTQIWKTLSPSVNWEGHRLDYVSTVFLILIFFNSKTLKGAAPESWVLLVPHCKTLEALSPEEQTAERTKKQKTKKIAWPREGSRQYDKQEVSIWRTGTREEGSLFWIQYLLKLTHEDPRAHFKQRAFSQLIKE